MVVFGPHLNPEPEAKALSPKPEPLPEPMLQPQISWFRV